MSGNTEISWSRLLVVKLAFSSLPSADSRKKASRRSPISGLDTCGCSKKTSGVSSSKEASGHLSRQSTTVSSIHWASAGSMNEFDSGQPAVPLARSRSLASRSSLGAWLFKLSISQS